MQIKSIHLINFRQFVNSKIEFSHDAEKNVTVILGQNTSGKTSLVQAFSWCLYGKEYTNFETKEVVNKSQVQTQKSVPTSVEIVLVHNKIEYTIKRSQLFQLKFNPSSKTLANSNDIQSVIDEVLSIKYIDEAGKSLEVNKNKCAEFVNTILDRDMSKYFFFTGEHINNIDKKTNVKEAVRTLMGLNIIANGKDHFNPSSSKSVYSKLKKELKPVSVDSNAQAKLVEIKAEFDTKQQSRDVLNEERTSLNKLLAEKNASMSQIDKVDLYKKEKLSIEKDLKNYKAQIDRYNRVLLDSFTKNAFKYFAKPLYKKSLDVLANADDNQSSIPHMNAASIDHIINSGKCLCGACIDQNENKAAYDNLILQKSLLNNIDIKTNIAVFQKSTVGFENDASGYFATIEKYNKDIQTSQDTLSEKEIRLKEIEMEIINFQQSDMESIQQERADLIGRINKLDTQFQATIQSIGNLEYQISDLSKSMSSSIANIEHNNKINEYMAYAQKMFEYFNEYYTEKSDSVKNKLKQSIQSIFGDMFHGKRVIEIDDNYKISLKIEDSNGNFELDHSMGEDTIKNFAFVVGLIDLARQEVSKNDTVLGLSAPETYPLVLDAPFSNTDTTHIKNISSVVPKVAEQVIFVLMEKDYTIAKEVLKDRVGSIFEIKKESETISHITKVGGAN